MVSIAIEGGNSNRVLTFTGLYAFGKRLLTLLCAHFVPWRNRTEEAEGVILSEEKRRRGRLFGRSHSMENYLPLIR
jgi:hypothetical protein